MGLIDGVTLTKDAAKQVAAQRITQNLQGLLSQIVRGYAITYQLVWNNPNDLTPQEVCDALGTNAGQLFSLAQQLKALVNAAKADAIKLTEPQTVTVNNDGTVTLTPTN